MKSHAINLPSQTQQDKAEEALQALWECVEAADGDLCGEVREWHLPRLKTYDNAARHHFGEFARTNF